MSDSNELVLRLNGVEPREAKDVKVVRDAGADDGAPLLWRLRIKRHGGNGLLQQPTLEPLGSVHAIEIRVQRFFLGPCRLVTKLGGIALSAARHQIHWRYCKRRKVCLWQMVIE